MSQSVTCSADELCLWPLAHQCRPDHRCTLGETKDHLSHETIPYIK